MAQRKLDLLARFQLNFSRSQHSQINTSLSVSVKCAYTLQALKSIFSAAGFCLIKTETVFPCFGFKGIFQTKLEILLHYNFKIQILPLQKTSNRDIFSQTFEVKLQLEL